MKQYEKKALKLPWEDAAEIAEIEIVDIDIPPRQNIAGISRSPNRASAERIVVMLIPVPGQFPEESGVQQRAFRRIGTRRNIDIQPVRHPHPVRQLHMVKDPRIPLLIGIPGIIDAMIQLRGGVAPAGTQIDGLPLGSTVNGAQFHQSFHGCIRNMG